MKCDYTNCTNEAINTRVTYYHDGGGALDKEFLCIEHTPEHDHIDAIGRREHTVWNNLITSSWDGGFWRKCEQCNTWQDSSELTWTDDSQWEVCQDCLAKYQGSK